MSWIKKEIDIERVGKRKTNKYVLNKQISRKDRNTKKTSGINQITFRSEWIIKWFECCIEVRFFRKISSQHECKFSKAFFCHQEMATKDENGLRRVDGRGKW